MTTSEDEAKAMACVICGMTPTIGFNREPIEAKHGRVCRTHARESVDRGIVVAMDDYGVFNWPVSL